MRDTWESQLIECSYGGLRLDVQSTSDELGRVLVTHAIPHREGAAVRDQGAEPRVTQCKLVFFPLDDQDDPRERFSLFKALADRGAHTFVHPITGSYRAYVGKISVNAAAEPREMLSVDAEFHEDSDEPAAFEEREIAPSASGLVEVEAAAQAFDDGLVEVNAELPEGAEPLTSDVGARAIATATAWDSSALDLNDPLTLRRVNMELVALSDAISAETDRLELATTPERWPLARTLSNLHHNLRRAASAFTQETPTIIEITVVHTTSVYALAASTYPGEPVDRRADQLIALNDLPNPARIEAGTKLRAYSRERRLRARRLI
jgi:prophage DNA circulation protein